MIAVIEINHTVTALRREAERLRANGEPMLASRVAALASEAQLAAQKREAHPWIK